MFSIQGVESGSWAASMKPTMTLMLQSAYETEQVSRQGGRLSSIQIVRHSARHGR
jgi:hypothetical protein